MSKAEIYYFSGTGNSLYAAGELQKRIPESELIPIVSTLKSDKIETKADIVGFIFPLHAFTIPIPVKEFLKKINLRSASYIFAIATRGGSPSIAFKDINRIIWKKGKLLDSQFYLDMPSNVIIVHGLDTQEEKKTKEILLKKNLESIQKIIIKKEKSCEKDPELDFMKEFIMFPIIGDILLPKFGRMLSFFADSKCTGCGNCEQVCLSKKIIMKDSNPVWQKNVACMFCFACINYCPTQSIQIRKTKTNTLGRYHHPEITAKEIAGQKLKA